MLRLRMTAATISIAAIVLGGGPASAAGGPGGLSGAFIGAPAPTGSPSFGGSRAPSGSPLASGFHTPSNPGVSGGLPHNVVPANPPLAPWRPPQPVSVPPAAGAPRPGFAQPRQGTGGVGANPGYAAGCGLGTLDCDDGGSYDSDNCWMNRRVIDSHGNFVRWRRTYVCNP